MSVVWESGVERGDRMADFLEQTYGSLAGAEVLDIGSGGGGISLAFARRCKSVTSADNLLESLLAVKARPDVEAQKNMRFTNLDAAALPFRAASFDLVILNGVIEWVGYGSPAEPARAVQLRCLREIRRVLRPGGRLYLGSENPWFPKHVLKDPHNSLPLVGLMPRPVKNLACRILKGRPYRNNIYSHWRLARMIRRAGFTAVQPFMPIYAYHFPFAIRSLDDPAAMLDAVQHLPADGLSPEYLKAGGGGPRTAWFYRTIIRLRLAKLLCHSLVEIAS